MHGLNSRATGTRCESIMQDHLIFGLINNAGADLVVSDHEGGAIGPFQAVHCLCHIPESINVQPRIDLIQHSNVCLQQTCLPHLSRWPRMSLDQ